MPHNITELWGFIAGLDQVSLMALFAHCASLTVNVVKQPWENKPQVQTTGNRLATALALDMRQHWTPTVLSYLGRVTKAHILAEAVGGEAAERIAGMKKLQMAEAAEQLLAGAEWLPPLLRTERPALLALQGDSLADAEVLDAAPSGEGESAEAEGLDEDPDEVHAEEDGMDDRPVFSEAAE